MIMSKEYLFEMFGTFFFTLIGTGCVAANVLTNGHFGQSEMAFCWGSAVAIAIYLCSSSSDCHFNPAFTIASYLFMGFKKEKVIPYITWQFVGGGISALIIYLAYRNLIKNYIGTPIHAFDFLTSSTLQGMRVARIFSTYPYPGVGYFNAFLVEFFITGLLFFCANKINYNQNIHTLLKPALIGFVIFLIGSSFGPLTAYAMNPARDLLPKVFLYLLGYGTTVLTGGFFLPYIFVPIIGPLLGSLAGAMIFIKSQKTAQSLSL
ncbi:MIP/aquaporin family protein [Martelella alba]|uniref:Aquaporin n=1 Tax=Martelella alba TaxID=2590451 RepID=A0ABY2SM95_9HYPH|nr:aquaporin [Martelella alba]TKI05990.1 aquaporin [Martelella alba]